MAQNFMSHSHRPCIGPGPNEKRLLASWSCQLVALSWSSVYSSSLNLFLNWCNEREVLGWCLTGGEVFESGEEMFYISVVGCCLLSIYLVDQLIRLAFE